MKPRLDKFKIHFEDVLEKEITATRAFSLKSGRILLQHQTKLPQLLDLFDFPAESIDYFFSV